VEEAGLLDLTATGRLGGELYGDAQLAKLEAYLARRNVTLVKNADTFLDSLKAGAAFEPLPNQAGNLYLRGNATSYDVWHELVHYRDFARLGYDEYIGLGSAAREQSVYEVLNGDRRWGMLNDAEQAYAVWQVSNYGIRP
jgi:hypothetical protein